MWTHHTPVLDRQTLVLDRDRARYTTLIAGGFVDLHMHAK